MSLTSTKPSSWRWIRTLLSGRPHQIIGSVDNPFLHRWYVIPPNPWVKVYVHKFIRSDDDRALHDHPWSFVSLILRGGYVEISEGVEGRTLALCRTSILDMRSPFWRRCIAFRSATYRHRVVLPWERTDGGYREQPCWTLIVTGPHQRTWGFWCPGSNWRSPKRFVPWREFGAAGCGETDG